jgi:hypothetical protein
MPIWKVADRMPLPIKAGRVKLAWPFVAAGV